MPSFCLSRLGAPHMGHAALVRVMLERDAGSCLVLVSSSDVVDQPETPLPWTERRDLLLALLPSGITKRLEFAPLPERPMTGWDSEWCAYILDAVRKALGIDPSRYVCGDDYPLDTFKALRAAAPSLELVRVPRRYGKSGHELRNAIVTEDAALLDKYRDELKVYGPATRDRIKQASSAR